jgi:hypothetical protein
MNPRGWPEINFPEPKIFTTNKMDCWMEEAGSSNAPEVFNMLKSNL